MHVKILTVKQKKHLHNIQAALDWQENVYRVLQQPIHLQKKKKN